MDNKKADYLESTIPPDELLLISMNNRLERETRLFNLAKLAKDHKVIQNKMTGVKYILDYEMAKSLFSYNPSALRYTFILTETENHKTEYIQRALECFPVFAEGESYEQLLGTAKLVQSFVEERIEKVNIMDIISSNLSHIVSSGSEKIDLLKSFRLINSKIAIELLDWSDLITAEKFNEKSKLIFSMFSGERVFTTESEVNEIYDTLIWLSRDEIAEKFNICRNSQSKIILPGVLMQWMTGFLTPCMTLVCYSFLNRFSGLTQCDKGNYSSIKICPGKAGFQENKNSCINDYIPFQTIHRAIVQDIDFEAHSFKKGDFVCIVPDALKFTTNKNIFSAVVGAPLRRCMGLKTSFKILDCYMKSYELISDKISKFDIDYEFVDSSSAIAFSEINLKLRET